MDREKQSSTADELRGGNGRTPSFLRDFQPLYQIDPHAAAKGWFKQARFGLFIHWGLFSRYGQGCSYLYDNKVPIADYRKTMELFTAEKFDACAVTDLALEAEMQYITFVARHHDGFSLWNTSTDFGYAYCSTASAARRDFVAELAEQCAEKGLGLFLYYSYGLDWAHPWFPTDVSGIVRAPERLENYHQWKPGHNADVYLEFVHEQLWELLTQYGPVAGIWFDPVSSVYQRPDLFPVEEVYRLIRHLQPHCLIAYKNGVTGDEDFITPEFRIHDGALEWLDSGIASAELKKEIRTNWQRKLRNGQKEFCSQLETQGWGYVKDTGRIDSGEVLRRLAYAKSQNSNLLLNTGLLFDGSVHPEAVRTLHEVGTHIREYGWPTPREQCDEQALAVE